LLYEDLVKQMKQETLDFHGVSRWHTLGLKGSGVKILNLEKYSGHGKDTFDMIRLVAPEPQIDWCQIGFSTVNNQTEYLSITTEEKSFTLADMPIYVDFLRNYDIITVSQSGSYPIELYEAFPKCGVILVSSAGNSVDGLKGVIGKFKDIGLSIGAIELDKDKRIIREDYSAIGDTIDFACLHGHLEGTSFSAPVLAGMIALIIQRYGKKTQQEIYNILKHISIDAGIKGFDTSFGFGVPVLPERIDDLETNKLTGRLGHLDHIYVAGGKVKKGQRIARMGNTGESTGSHLDLAFVYGEHGFFTYSDIETGKYIPCEPILYDFATYDLFKTEPYITTFYREPGYNDLYAHGLYEHYGLDLVPKNRKETTANFDIYAPINLEILATGYNSKLGNYMVIGVDIMEFKDIAGHWAEASIKKAVEKGVVNGYDDGTFRPDKMPTRAELVVILDRLGLLD